jgi:ketosteroid isomerase-like protein
MTSRPPAPEASGSLRRPPSRSGIVRKPLSVGTRSGRTFDQRLALRFPSLSRLARWFVGRLPPESRIRQALNWRGVRLGFEAFNRRDLDAALIYFRRDAQFFPPRPLIESGIVESSYRGHDGYRRFWREWLAAWGRYRAEPQELIDLGDRLLILGRLKGHGDGSGTPVEQEYAALIYLTHGQVARQQEYFEHAQALDEVGLRE